MAPREDVDDDEGLPVVPGELLGRVEDVLAGEGAYVDAEGFVRACVVGLVRRTALSAQDGRTQTSSVSVQAAEHSRHSLMPRVGEIVVCKVVRINPRVANVEIMCTAGGSLVLQEACSGLIRKEDVRQFDRDSVEMFKSMRPGDVVNARVLSLGDSRSYVLSTAENELGVILARSVSGAIMIPLTFEEVCANVPPVHAFYFVPRLHLRLTPSMLPVPIVRVPDAVSKNHVHRVP